MDIGNWYATRDRLPSMKKEDLFIKYAESAGQRDEDYLWDKIKSLHDLDDPTKSSDSIEFAKNACSKFVKLAVENPALYDFVLDTDYPEYWDIVDPEGKVKNRSRLASEFFIPWVAVCVPRSIALEVVYGYGIDIYGNYREIPKTDPFYYFVYKNDLFAAIAERGIATVDWLTENHPQKISFLAAGMAPEFRHLGLSLDENQEAILADNDPTINVHDLFKGLSFEDRITYLNGEAGNLATVLAGDTLKDSDVIIANGIICYIWDKFPQILTGVKRQLKPGGTFIFELYPHHWEWARNRDIKGFYLNLKLFENINDAVKNVKAIASYLGITDITEKYYFDDFGNEIMVLFTITMPT